MDIYIYINDTAALVYSVRLGLLPTWLDENQFFPE